MKKKIFATQIDESFLIGLGDNVPFKIKDEEIVKLLNRNKEFSNVKILGCRYGDGENLKFHYYSLEYEGKIYEFAIRIYHNIKYEIEAMLAKIQYLNENDREFLNSVDRGIEVLIFFDEDIDRSYKLQFKILDTIFPDYRMVADMSSIYIFNKYWVKGFIKDKIELEQKYRYNIHVTKDEFDQIWVHSHGLLRLGLRDIQICGDIENLKKYYIILNKAIEKLLSQDIYSYNQEEKIFEFMGNDFTLCETGEQDRLSNNQEDSYLDVKKYIDDNRYCDLDEIDLSYSMNHINLNEISLYNSANYIDIDETNKLREEALKYFWVFEKYYRKYNGLIKCAIPYDLDYDNLDLEEAECMWFKNIKINEDGDFEGELINDPIFILDVEKGDILTIPKKGLIDWNLYLEDCEINYKNWVILEGEDGEKENNSFFKKIKGLLKR